MKHISKAIIMIFSLLLDILGVVLIIKSPMLTYKMVDFNYVDSYIITADTFALIYELSYLILGFVFVLFGMLTLICIRKK